jgi:hypothetical protein
MKPLQNVILSASEESGEAVPTHQMLHFVQHHNVRLG